MTDLAYDFSGNVLSKRETHTIDTYSPAETLTTKMTYDHASRLLSETSIQNGGQPAKVIYGYDELGRMTKKRM